VLNSGLTDIYKSTFYKTNFAIQQGMEMGTRLDLIDQNRIEHILNKPWGTDGLNGAPRTFSERVWGNNKKLLNTLNKEVKTGLIRGDPIEDIIDKFTEKMNVDTHRAATLIKTEAAVFNTKSTHDCFVDIGVKEYQIDTVLDERRSEICESMDQKVIPMSEFEIGLTAPPFHPRCRTGITPYIDDEFEREYDERIAMKSNGETYKVPGDMSYKKWYNKYVKKPTGNGDWLKNSAG